MYIVCDLYATKYVTDGIQCDLIPWPLTYLELIISTENDKRTARYMEQIENDSQGDLGLWSFTNTYRSSDGQV